LADLALSESADAARRRLLEWLKAARYAFVTPTPATHARVLRHPGKDRARSLRDVFGWSLPFDRSVTPPDLLALMRDADIVEGDGEAMRSRVRVSSLDRLLLMHSAYPTDDKEAVFFGPDSYRFAAFVRRELAKGPAPRRLADLGAGAGAGALAAGLDWPEAELTLTDVNPSALWLARVNAAAAGLTVHTMETDSLSEAGGPFDVVIANPPYIVDPGDREYRDGGGEHGEAISLKMAKMALDCLTPGGRVLLYTGVAIIEGRDPVREGLEALGRQMGATLSYDEIDPDVFGEELAGPDYQDVDRIAAVGAVLTRA
jgi:methylase of polypeptide subunit release factors